MLIKHIFIDNSGSWQPVLELRGTGLLSLPNGTLVMEVVSIKDQGEYSCRVENGVGQPLSKSIWITVNSKFINDKSNKYLKYIFFNKFFLCYRACNI